MLMGWKWDPLTAFVIIATALTILVICVYITTCAACFAYYWRERRDQFNVWLHAVCPAVGALAFLAPLYYQCRPLPPYPTRYANWIAIAWIVLGLLVTAYLMRTRREALTAAGKVFVEDERGPAPPVAAPAPARGS
jgi:amino acid transporter